MSELVIFGTQEETGAAEMRISVQRLQEKGKMLCEDAAIVERHADNSVEFKVVKKLVSKGILGEGFWGALVQAIPWTSTEATEITDPQKQLAEAGIDAAFLEQAVNIIPPVNSGLFLIVKDKLSENALDVLMKFSPKVLRRPLTAEQMQKLAASFAS